ncbi:hypothetical protein M422DRAFT_179896 [Sphaerobolus stellatus SS14]|uniref:Uncharacterized protein n=1 Tax=Sphaerobolus stellatus (strain SS14) TaxID=990650 RepID=A0A0C9VF99_SPHS4|nr:hypothetical protein M422DRAFT_179896 [Sphaerobolus stellatus SS14]
MRDSERHYVDLLFSATNKYGSWDPEIPVQCGDYGRITQGASSWAFWRKHRGTFLKEGNIYVDGTADKWGIPPPLDIVEDDGEGLTWITSRNAIERDLSGDINGDIGALANCSLKVSFKISSGSAAVLVMENEATTLIDPPAKLLPLLEDHEMQGRVIVSQTHRCSSYARLLTAQGDSNVTVGLNATALTDGPASAQTMAKWVRSTAGGYFKSRINRTGKRSFYPLFKLVSVKQEAISVGLRGESDEQELPDAIPPWLTQSTSPSK